MCLPEPVLRMENREGTGFATNAQRSAPLQGKTRCWQATARWPPKDGQPVVTAEVRLFAGNERCADRVDGRPRQTEADDNVARHCKTLGRPAHFAACEP